MQETQASTAVLRRSPGGGSGNSQPTYSWLGNPTDRVAWWAIVPGVAK